MRRSALEGRDGEHKYKKGLSMSTSSTAQWSSRLGFILASAGSAIGIGAIWKFPFWAGANGGGAFIIPYIFFTFTIGVMLVMAEIALGRRGRGSAVSAMMRVSGRWSAPLGVFAVLTSFLILSYYSVVGGWCVAYLFDAVTGSVAISDAEALKAHFANLVSDGYLNVGWHFVFLVITCGTVALGVQQGIERLSKYLMPTLFILMLAIIVRCLMLDGAWEGVKYLFAFDWDTVTSSAILNAMGFTFFSLSLGAGILITYGSYLQKESNIVSASIWVAVLAIQAALLAGLMIMPAVFAFGLEPNAGPGLVFVTVPMIFSQIPLGGFFALLFYICLLTAALTSAVSLLEVVVAFLHNEWHLSRRLSVTVCFVSLFLLGAVSALSFGVWSDFTIGGRNFFDFLDFVCTNFMMPAGGLAVAAIMGWKAWPIFKEELVTAKPYSETVLSTIHWIVAILAPILVLVAVFQGLFG